MANDDELVASQRIEAMRHILATMFAAKTCCYLSLRVPVDRCSLLGDFGERLVIDHDGLINVQAGRPRTTP